MFRQLTLSLIGLSFVSGQEALEPLDTLDPLDLSGSVGEDFGELDATVIESASNLALRDFSPLPSELLEEQELQRLVQGTLGETLGWQPGINSAFYGQGASRPVIRGFDGFRVRLLRDSVGTLDVSASSPDHGLPLEPLLLREVEIFRGPAALLYGNSALGGAINTQTRSFATEMPDRLFSGAIENRFDTASSGWSQSAYFNVAHGDWVLTLTGSNRTADDYEIPGRARTSAYERAFNPIVNDPTTGSTQAIKNPDGTLPNSHLESQSYSVGLSWLPAELPLTASAAYSYFDSEYGLPYLFGGDANDLFGDSSLAMRQERMDFRLSYLADQPWLTEAVFHFGYGDYQHAESFAGRLKDEGTDFTDTRFELDAWEARIDLIHEPTDWWRGVVGAQFISRALDPSFLAAAPQPNSRFFNSFETQNLGLFANETLTWGDFEFTAALRWETQQIDDLSLAAFGFTREVDDTSLSSIMGVSWEKQNVSFFDRLKVNLNASYVERLPTETERFAFWNNPAIQRFIIGGDLGGTPLDTEQSLGLDLGVQGEIGEVGFQLNAFNYRIDNFIFLQDLRGIGNQAQYTATDARFYGLEFEANWTLYEQDDDGLYLTFMGDWIRAEQRSDDSPLPRIPPFRLGSRLEWTSGNFEAGIELRYAFEQDRVQESSGVVQGEMPTDAYTELNLDFSHDFQIGDTQQLTVFLQGRNLLDSERRLHTSFLKDVAPLPGRSWILGARLEF